MMSYARHAVKVLGVCLVAALGLMAFLAAGAQAKWTVGGAGIGATTPSIAGHTLGDFVLLSSVGAIKVEILCELLEVNGYLTETPALTVHAALSFSKNCTTFLNLTANAKCKPLEPIIALAKGKLILHPVGGTTYILVEALESQSKLPLATPHLGEGTCSIGLNFPITGSAVVECVTNTCTENVVSHKIKVLLPSALFSSDNLFFGTNAASFHGEGVLERGGQTWSGVG